MAGPSTNFFLQTFETFDRAKPATLPTGPVEVHDGDTFIVSGWGTTLESGSLASTLKQLEIPYVNDAVCSLIYRSENIFNDVMICAGNAGHNSCVGDSGGPMTLGGLHVGIISWGYGCGRPGIPWVYAQTDAFLEWIDEETSNNRASTGTTILPNFMVELFLLCLVKGIFCIV